MIEADHSFTIGALREGYRAGRFVPADVVTLALQRIDADSARNVWISYSTRQSLDALLRRLADLHPDDLPLYGIPFAIKDNIDLEGVATTVACPAFAYTPDRSATVVEKLVAAGAIPIGKTNMDQFATGLVGTRSPYGTCANAFDQRFIAGGSSSGSAVAVALGQVAFALGTDTAGSGRVPAAFNNLVGVKPTCGRLSTRGVFPACRTLDCVSIFALTVDDARHVLQVAEGFDAADPFSRRIPAQAPRRLPRAGLRVGVPPQAQLSFFGDEGYAAAFARAMERWRALGATLVDFDFEPYAQAARLLYEGPWLAERVLAVGDFLRDHADEILPVTAKVIAAGADGRATDAFAARYRLAELRRRTESTWSSVDVALIPTAGTIYRVDEIERDPIHLNSTLGTYCNFMNLLDLSAIALPAGFRDDGLPFGVTLFAPAFRDDALLDLGRRWQAHAGWPLGATGKLRPVDPIPAADDCDGRVEVVVCGAHMEGLPLNSQLTDRGAELVGRTRTAPRYRFYALAGGPPERPGLVRTHEAAVSVAVEVWRMPIDHFGSFVAGIPAPLGIGKVELVDGTWACGFLCESHALADAVDISALADWREYLQQRRSSP